jgi:hypothetical protein
MKNLHSLLKQHCDLVVASSEITEGACLAIKCFSDRFNGVAVLELDGEWVSEEVYRRLDFIFL